MSQIYEIPIPNLNLHVQYKLLSPGEIERVTSEPVDSPENFRRYVLEQTIVNLNTEVTPALRKIPKDLGKVIVNSLFHGAIMLNPGLDVETWIRLASPGISVPTKKITKKPISKRKSKKITRSHFLGLERYLKERVIGQDQAIHQVVNALKRSQVGLNDERRPIGVFLFAGASGVGKTHLARELHNYLFGSEHDLVRVDCGEYQHKHENSKLIGAPPGYLGYDEGGHLTNLVKKNPNTVILLDEVEKAHPDIWNTFLRVFDEGMITDASGKEISFRDTVIIMTTNLGNRQVVEEYTEAQIGFASEALDVSSLPKRERVERLAHAAIRKFARPEFLNRLDKIVIFNHLTKEDFERISELELGEVNTKLSKKGFSLIFDDAVVAAMVNDGMSSVQGARRLSQIRRDKIEDMLADYLLGSRYPRGTVFQLTRGTENYVITAQRPKRSEAKANVGSE